MKYLPFLLYIFQSTYRVGCRGPKLISILFVTSKLQMDEQIFLFNDSFNVK